MTAPAVAESLPDRMLRVARNSGALRFSEISPQDALLVKAGNRFDVPGGKVLYAATNLDACFAETLARFRPTPKMAALLKGHNDGFMIVGGVPQDWRLQRSIFELELSDPLPFLDVEAPETQAHLSEVLAQELVALGYTENLDISHVCNDDRRLSRLIANYAYAASDGAGEAIYSGIRYASRVYPGWECWAIFHGTAVEVASQRSIDVNEPALQAVAKMWKLRPY